MVPHDVLQERRHTAFAKTHEIPLQAEPQWRLDCDLRVGNDCSVILEGRQPKIFYAGDLPLWPSNGGKGDAAKLGIECRPTPPT
jgi:hypothetical protein